MKQNPHNILNLEDKSYPENCPNKNHEIDIPYALFQRYEPLELKEEYAFFTDTSICTGCKSCEVACKQWNQLKNEQIAWSGNSYDNTLKLSACNWRHVKFIERFPEKNNLNAPAPTNIHALLHEPKIGDWHMMSDQCKHCRESPCHNACPTGAIIRNEYGGIYYQTDICMGCRMCIAACPFGVPEIGTSHHSQKCAECYDRLRDGLTPACQLACTTGAIQFGPRDTMLEQARIRLEFLHSHGYPQARLYGADSFAFYPSLNSFYLLLDAPEVYGLPPQPTTPIQNMPGDYLRAIATLIICTIAIIACL